MIRCCGRRLALLVFGVSVSCWGQGTGFDFHGCDDYLADLERSTVTSSAESAHPEKVRRIARVRFIEEVEEARLRNADQTRVQVEALYRRMTDCLFEELTDLTNRRAELIVLRTELVQAQLHGEPTEVLETLLELLQRVQPPASEELRLAFSDYAFSIVTRDPEWDRFGSELSNVRLSRARIVAAAGRWGTLLRPTEMAEIYPRESWGKNGVAKRGLEIGQTLDQAKFLSALRVRFFRDLITHLDPELRYSEVAKERFSARYERLIVSLTPRQRPVVFVRGAEREQAIAEARQLTHSSRSPAILREDLGRHLRMVEDFELPLDPFTLQYISALHRLGIP